MSFGVIIAYPKRFFHRNPAHRGNSVGGKWGGAESADKTTGGLFGMIDHMPAGPDNGGLTGGFFHTGGIIGAVKPVRHGDGAFCRMVGQQQGKRNFQMVLLCGFYGFGRKPVKAAVTANDKFGHAIARDMIHDGRTQGRIDFFRRFPMAYKETAFSFHRNRPLCTCVYR